MSYKLSHVECCEEMIMNSKWPNPDEAATGWRRFRIEYKNEQGFSNIEGCLYFPPDVDPYPILDEVCDRLNNTVRRD